MACVSSSSCWLPASLTFRHLRSQHWLQYCVTQFERHRLDTNIVCNGCCEQHKPACAMNSVRMCNHL